MKGEKTVKRHEPYNKVEGFKRENHITNLMIANVLGLSEASVIKKNIGKSDYYVSEVKKLMRDLNFPLDVFLP
jgi:betR domain